MPTTWTIVVDWDRNGNYSDTYDDVTSRVISAKWLLGQRAAYATIANDSTLEVVLENVDRRYSPEYGSSPLFGNVVSQRPVRVQSNDGTTTRTHWVGWVEIIQPEVGQYRKRTVRIRATGVMQFYKAAETNLPLQENKRTDEIISALLAEVTIPPALGQLVSLDPLEVFKRYVTANPVNDVVGESPSS